SQCYGGAARVVQGAMNVLKAGPEISVGAMFGERILCCPRRFSGFGAVAQTIACQQVEPVALVNRSPGVTALCFALNRYREPCDGAVEASFSRRLRSAGR